MNDQVALLLQVAVKPGELESLKALLGDLAESSRAEPGTLVYEQSINDANDLVQSYERFADSAAALTHLGTFGEKFGERFWAAVTPTALWVYGSPSDEVKQVLNPFNPVYMGHFGGFSRL